MSDDYKATFVRARLHYVRERCRMLVPEERTPNDTGGVADVQNAKDVAARGLAQLPDDVGQATLTALTADSIFIRGLLRMLEPSMDEALRQRIAQSERARKPRNSEIDTIINQLARHKDKYDDLWSSFYGELERALCGPRWGDNEGKAQRAITYSGTTGAARRMTYKTFRERIRKARRAKTAQ